MGARAGGVGDRGGLVMRVADALGRPLRSLRVSVTDRCNLRCGYCMPEEEYAWLPRDQILHFEEMSGLVDVFLDLGVDKVRLTGGEPLLRRNLPELVRQLAGKPRLRDLAMTTNGVLLAEHARALKDAGLHRVTVSLDTLHPERFPALTRRPAETHAQVLAGIAAVRPFVRPQPSHRRRHVVPLPLRGRGRRSARAASPGRDSRGAGCAHHRWVARPRRSRRRGATGRERPRALDADRAAQARSTF